MHMHMHMHTHKHTHNRHTRSTHLDCPLSQVLWQTIAASLLATVTTSCAIWVERQTGVSG